MFRVIDGKIVDDNPKVTVDRKLLMEIANEAALLVYPTDCAAKVDLECRILALLQEKTGGIL